MFEREDRLGWYHRAGQVAISTKVANDSSRLAEVRNHELNHHLIASTTPYGLVQAALQGAADYLRIRDRDPEANKSYSEVQRAIDLTADVSNLAHEAVATYASLAILPSDARDQAIGRLPTLYREGYDLFSAFFANREIAGMDQLWITRTIGARAFQTSIVDRWFEQELNVPTNLAHYLTHLENRPNERLSRILKFLEPIGDDEIRNYIGSYVGERDDELRPSRLADDAITGISIHGIPEQRLEVCETIARSVGAVGRHPFGYLDPFYGNSIIEPIQPVVQYPPDNRVEVDWASGADFALLRINYFDYDIEEQFDDIRRKVPAKSADVTLLRPDYASGIVINVPLPDILKVVYMPDEKIPVLCPIDQFVGMALDNWGEGKDPGDGLLRYRTWLPHQHLVLDSMGFPEELVLLFTLLRNKTSTWVGMGYPMSPEWGYVLLRPLNGGWPFVLHPTLFVEWNRLLSSPFGEQIRSVESPLFLFYGEPRLAHVVFLAMRTQFGIVARKKEWEQMLERLVAKIYP